MAKIKITKKFPTKGFAGSLIQQTFGEDPFGHGYLLWDIENGSVQEINIDNEHRLIKFEITPNTDYDKLHLTSRYVGRYNKFRVEWNDYAAFITNDNEIKIRKYLKEKYNADDIEIRPNRIYTDIKDGKMLSEILDINDKEVQQEIIKKYLKENKFEDEFIDQIIEVDNTINDRLQLSDTKNIIWNIDKIWFNNFKSYGDDNVIEWDNINGIIQIAGENQQGKTSIIDAICFILYGTTVSTTKTEKNGNNRYINKNRKLNHCDGGAVLDVNGEKYIMYRKVEREFKKGREIKAVPMSLDYYKGTEMIEENKLTGERKTSTQKFLDEVLGDFNDFIRMALTNADNLNALLSVDRSVFIDSIIKDAGYDVFEKKLEEFKLYKKELNLDKVSVNVSDIENQIKRIDDDLKDKEDYLSDINQDIIDTDNEIEENTTSKEDCLRRLHKIDEDILKINIEDVKKKIKEKKRDKDKLEEEVTNLEKDIVLLPSKFDNFVLESLTSQNEKWTNEKARRDIEIVQLSSLVNQNDERIKNVDKDIQREKNKYLEFLDNNIFETKKELREVINEVNNNSENKRYQLENQRNNIKNELNTLKQGGLDEKKKISSYNDMLSGKNQICPTCNQPIINKDEEHMTGLINESTKKIEDITKTAKQKIELLNECSSKIDSLKEMTDKLIEDKKLEYEKKIKIIRDKIDNFDISVIADRVSEVERNKELAELENASLAKKIEEREKFVEKLNIEIKKANLKISSLKIEKALNEKYTTLSHRRDLLVSESKDAKREFEDNTRLYNEYNKNENLIIENEKIKNDLVSIKERIDSLTSKKGELMNNKLSYSNEITLSKKVVEDLKDKLERYIAQEKLEELHNVYLKLMHRTGLPTYLLTKNIDILNEELDSLLTNTDFTLFFDEDLNLNLQHDGLSDIIKAIETSGMERTFSAIVLKMVLRIINFKSKPNFMFMDEVIDRLANKSVDKFMELLETLRSKIDKIIVIDHSNSIQSDLIINAMKDENGISKFEII